MSNKNINKETLRHVTERSRQMLDDQLQSQTNLHNKSGIILSTIGLTMTIGLAIVGFDGVPNWLVFISALPIGILAFAAWKLMKVLVSRPMLVGLGVHEYDRIIELNEEEALLEDLAANRESLKGNSILIRDMHKWFTQAIKASGIAGLIILLTLFTYFCVHQWEAKKSPSIENVSTMSNSDQNQGANQNPAENDNSNSQGGSRIPEIRPDQLQTQERGLDSTSLPTKDK